LNHAPRSRAAAMRPPGQRRSSWFADSISPFPPVLKHAARWLTCRAPASGRSIRTPWNRFAVRLSHAHLADLRVPLEHGEVVLLVDVPFHRVREIEHLVAERHPEVGVGGVGWTVEAFGV